MGPTIELVIRDGQPTYQAIGHGVVVHHQQREQALLGWFILAVAAGYEGPAPLINP